jgi:microcystin-dependent protein
VTLNAAELPNHTHAATATSAKATSNNPVGRIWAKAKGTSLYATTNDNPVPMNESALGVSGSQTPQAHDNVQPCLGMYFAMAYEGMFPVRP